jgi:hypothetical protein
MYSRVVCHDDELEDLAMKSLILTSEWGRVQFPMCFSSSLINADAAAALLCRYHYYYIPLSLSNPLCIPMVIVCV